MNKKGSDSIGISAYQKWVRKRWKSGNKKLTLRKSGNKKLTLRDYYIMTAGLGGETGEVLEILKKSIRDKKLDKIHLTEELGDILYYLTMVCNFHGLKLEETFTYNVTKLNNRQKKM